MLVPAERLFEEKKFEDTAYFEPFYLKEFVPTVSKKKIISVNDIRKMLLQFPEAAFFLCHVNARALYSSIF